MAKKRAAKMQTTKDEKSTRPVRLDLDVADHERLERCAKRLGLSKSSYVRLALFERMATDEGGS